MIYSQQIVRYCFVGLLFFLVTETAANNVRIKGDVRVFPENIVHEVGKAEIATFSFTVTWDNSWRDKFNYDAVYVFVKHRMRNQGEAWYQVYLQDAGNTVTDGYTLELKNNTGKANKNEGFFLYRKNNGYGGAEVNVTLKWDIASSERSNGLKIGDFEDGNVLLAAMGIEMVYVPRGAFRAGDNVSVNHFRNNYLPMPEKYDIVPNARSYRTSSIMGGELYCDPKLAANQINDISAEVNPKTGFPTNAWYGDKVGVDDRGQLGYQYWSCSFTQARVVRYLAIESVPGFVPAKWRLEAQTSSNPGSNWEVLYNGTAADWETGLVRTYPPTRAFRVNAYNLSAYAFRIYMNQEDMPGGMNGNPPLIKKVAMAEADLENLVDNSVLINEPVLHLGTLTGLAAEDGDEWSGKTDKDYPNGYSAFYAMKYEISQEQYVAFLNKLDIRQQRSRTIGGALELLNPGEYVFGSRRTSPSCRNGIILARHATEYEPAVFEAKKEEGVTDGTIACNYLTLADMLAYADWSGLRPMTELEYEKMCRPFYPTEVGRGDYPWMSSSYEPVASLERPGTNEERPSTGSANVNFGKQSGIGGPVRSGAFLARATKREQSGANFWGAMETAGNLAEIYYNAGTEGRMFRGVAVNLHGNGYLNADGGTDIGESYWPREPRSLIAKGGHWADTDERLLAASDRTRNRTFFTANNIDRRDSTISFRLGHTAPINNESIKLTLQNGLFTTGMAAGVAATDTVCHGDVYVIEGDMPEDMRSGLYSIVWYRSENQGVTWEPVEGAGDQNLIITRLWNVNTIEDRILEVWFRKEIYGYRMDAKSDKVVLRILNSNTYPVRLTDTLDVYDHSEGVRMNLNMKGKIDWLFNGREENISYDVQPANLEKSAVGAPLYYSLSGQNTSYIIRSDFLGRCIEYDTVHTYRRPEPSIQASNAGDWTCGNFLLDSRDGKKYRTVKIGDQCWMADNLNYMEIGSRCYGDQTGNCDSYGRLYNWKQAVGTWYVQGSGQNIQGICPSGWHVPNINEWQLLGVWDGKSWRSQRNVWTRTTGDPHVFPFADLATNTSRFSALPGGGYFFNYSTAAAQGSSLLPRVTGYWDLGHRAWWWSSTGLSGSYTNTASGGFADATIPTYASVNNANGVVIQNSVGSGSNSLFYGPLIYLGNGSTLSADTKYNATVALENNFYFSVRCLKD